MRGAPSARRAAPAAARRWRWRAASRRLRSRPMAAARRGFPPPATAWSGLKQSNGVIPHSQALDVFGNQTYVTPMTRTVADTALMMQAMAGEDACDPWSIGVPVPDFIGTAAPRGDLRGQKILYCLSPPGRPVSADVAASFKASLDRLAGLGAELEEFSGEGFDIEPIWRAINHTVWRTRFAKLAAEHRGRAERGLPSSSLRLPPTSAASPIRRRCSRARRCSAGCNPACARASLGDADHHPHRAADRPGPVRHHRDRRQAL